MGDLPTIAIKKGDSDYKIINEKDFDPAKGHVKYEGVLPRDTVTDLANRNADGTFSEPTPTDIRYPNKDMTEFANNHGAHVNRSAAEMREEMNLPDAPGGLAPDPALAEMVEKNKKAEKDAKTQAADTKKAENESSSAKSEAKK